jgi:hypothetical protein
MFFGDGQAHFGIDTKNDFFEPCSEIHDIPALRERTQAQIDCIKAIIDGFLLLDELFQEGASADALEKRELYTRLARSLAKGTSERDEA